MRQKTCPFCRNRYTPSRPIQANCCESFECKSAFIAAHVQKQRQQRAKAERIAQQESRKVIKLKLEAIKPRSKLLREAQAAFNAYIRARDKADGHPCISSGRPLDWNASNKVDAGHYRSTGSAPHLRFDERNCHAQSKQDNRFLAGNAVDYRIGLVARIGLEAVEALDADQEPRKYSTDDLRAIKAHYVAKRKELCK